LPGTCPASDEEREGLLRAHPPADGAAPLPAPADQTLQRARCDRAPLLPAAVIGKRRG
jgi:hypothetical protein